MIETLKKRNRKTETTDQRQGYSDITDYVKDPGDNKPTNQPKDRMMKISESKEKMIIYHQG